MADSRDSKPFGLALYSKAAQASTNQVIETYSTSFGWATKLLGESVRQDVRNIYGLVRVADEIVDGAANKDVAEKLLDELEAETYRAIEIGFSANLVVHAFALSAVKCSIEREIIEPFFYSMRADLTQREHDQASFDRYVYGSAEVVGLMCLRAFLTDSTAVYSAEEERRLVAGARALGAAFQKVNFLRDLAADFNALGRSYFPGITAQNFTDADRDRLVAEIAGEIEIAARELPNLPRNCDRAVAAALMLFGELNQKISQTPASKLATTRIRVSDPRKLAIVLNAMTRRAR